jgi:hypothetical protein
MKKAGSQYISHQTTQSDFVRPFRLNNRFDLSSISKVPTQLITNAPVPVALLYEPTLPIDLKEDGDRSHDNAISFGCGRGTSFPRGASNSAGRIRLI